MGDLSKDFSRWEWRCKCGCGEDTVDHELIDKVLQPMRDELGERVHVTPNGGFRCHKQNEESEGADNSQHLRGRASDVWVENFAPRDIYNYLCRKHPGKYGFGLYKTFVHIDTKSGPPRRWKG